LLGLDHSRLSSALMAPYYNAFIAKPQTVDDIPRIVALMGPKTVPAPPPPPGQPPPTAPKTRLIVDVEGTITSIQRIPAAGS